MEEDPNQIVMKETILMTENVALASSSGLVETFIRANIRTTNATDMVKCTGLMEVATRANGLGASSTVMGE